MGFPALPSTPAPWPYVDIVSKTVAVLSWSPRLHHQEAEVRALYFPFSPSHHVHPPAADRNLLLGTDWLSGTLYAYSSADCSGTALGKISRDTSECWAVDDFNGWGQVVGSIGLESVAL